MNGIEVSPVYNKSGAQTDAYDIDGNLVSAPQRVLVFEDDFDSFNSSMWVKEVGNVRNYNTELQCYREQNVAIENSCLVLTAKKENYGGKAWTSGSISGQTKQAFSFGRYEAKIKFPNLMGAFGAFWCLGSNFWKEYVDGGQPTNHGVLWPECGEIDITETMPGNSDVAQANLWSYTGTSLGSGTSSEIISSQWHIYAVERTSEYIAISIDGTEFKRWTFSDYQASTVQAYQLPFYMILNLAVGASGGIPDASTTEMKMYVDWVRVYAPLS